MTDQTVLALTGPSIQSKASGQVEQRVTAGGQTVIERSPEPGERVEGGVQRAHPHGL
jgi:hypothetical protein